MLGFNNGLSGSICLGGLSQPAPPAAPEMPLGTCLGSSPMNPAPTFNAAALGTCLGSTGQIAAPEIPLGTCLGAEAAPQMSTHTDMYACQNLAGGLASGSMTIGSSCNAASMISAASSGFNNNNTCGSQGAGFMGTMSSGAGFASACNNNNLGGGAGAGLLGLGGSAIFGGGLGSANLGGFGGGIGLGGMGGCDPSWGACGGSTACGTQADYCQSGALGSAWR